MDLYGITKQALRASVERYSLKDLEIFFGFERQTDLRDASRSLRLLECALELNDSDGLLPEVLTTVEAYNREDCISAFRLRKWLEDIRHSLIAQGQDIPRPPLQPEEPSEAGGSVEAKRVLALMEALLAGISDDPEQRSPEQQAQWLLAYMLEWHRREDKAPWWEYFRLRDLTDAERLEERSAISGLEFVKRIGGTEKCPIDRYRFPEQDTQVRYGDELHTSQGKFGEVDHIEYADRTIDVKKTGAMAEIHPVSAFVQNIVRSQELAESLFRLGSCVAKYGIDAPGSISSGARPALA